MQVCMYEYVYVPCTMNCNFQTDLAAVFFEPNAKQKVTFFLPVPTGR